MATLAESVKAAGLKSAAELTRMTGVSKETLTNWLKDKPLLFEIVLKGATARTQTQEPEQPKGQTWTFSQEDLQEQARQLEKLFSENLELKARLELKEKETEQLKKALENEKLLHESCVKTTVSLRNEISEKHKIYEEYLKKYNILNKETLPKLKQEIKKLKDADKDLIKRNDSLWETIQICKEESETIERYIKEVYGEDIKNIISEAKTKALIKIRLSGG